MIAEGEQRRRFSARMRRRQPALVISLIRDLMEAGQPLAGVEVPLPNGQLVSLGEYVGAMPLAQRANGDES